MGSLFNQFGAITMLNVKSIPHRMAMSISTVVAVAMAVAVLLGFMALAEGFRATVQGGGATDVAIVMRDGADSELSSILLSDQLHLIEEAPGVAHQGDTPLVSGELYLIVDGIKKSSNTKANMTLRGMSATGLAVRRGVHIAEGRMFTPGTNEIVVGRGLLREFSGFELNRTIRLGANTWKVVGVFEAPGTVFESELWADARVVQSLFNRGNSYQTARVRVNGVAGFNQLKHAIESDPRLKLLVRTEQQYYQSQAGQTSDLIGMIGTPLAIVMAIGALAGALNTMYGSVAARAAEIATLRIIGFSGYAAFFGTLVEAIVLSIIGGLVGALFCFIFFNGMTTSTLGSNFTQVVFQLKFTPALLVAAVVMAAIIGFVGGFFPGIRAARQSPQLELAAAQ
ncbi:MAG TPA: ABC transporter permease [Caulobacterales bacterium]|nr:ABC transporter permease [Caulobacterales bacterium]